MTANGTKILDIINNSTSHPTADDIFYELRARGDKVSLATVYNNLNSLSELGMIKKLTFDGKSDRFDKIVRHDHLVCSKCGTVTDVCFDDLTRGLAEKFNGNATGYELKIFHICENCKR